MMLFDILPVPLLATSDFLTDSGFISQILNADLLQFLTENKHLHSVTWLNGFLFTLAAGVLVFLLKRETDRLDQHQITLEQNKSSLNSTNQTLKSAVKRMQAGTITKTGNNNRTEQRVAASDKARPKQVAEHPSESAHQPTASMEANELDELRASFRADTIVTLIAENFRAEANKMNKKFSSLIGNSRKMAEINPDYLENILRSVLRKALHLTPEKGGINMTASEGRDGQYHVEVWFADESISGKDLKPFFQNSNSYESVQTDLSDDVSHESTGTFDLFTPLDHSITKPVRVSVLDKGGLRFDISIPLSETHSRQRHLDLMSLSVDFASSLR